MSKKTKRLIILAAVLVVLLAVYLVVWLVGQKKAQQDAYDADVAKNGFVIREMKEDKIVGFSYQHVGDENYDDTQYIFSKQGDTWYYKNDLHFPVNQDIAAMRVEELSKVYAKRLLEETDENFAAYGLDAPKLIISVTDGKETITYNLGNYNESTADYYMNIEGTNEVYTVDPTLWVGFSMGLYDMVQMETFPEIQDDHITDLIIETKNDTLTFDYEITGTQEDAATNTVKNVGDWYIIDSEGERVRANNSKVSSLVAAIIGTEYVQEANYNCPDEEMAAYGLDDPAVKITICYTVDKVDLSSVSQEQVTDNISEIQYDTNTQAYELVLSIGNATETFAFTDDYYIRTSLNNSVMTIDAQSAETYGSLLRDNFVSVQKIELPTEAAGN